MPNWPGYSFPSFFLITNLYKPRYSCDFMGPEVFALKVLEWLIGETLGKEILSKIKKIIVGDEFRILGNRALQETIRGNHEYKRILNTLRENGVFEVDDATELDTEKICGTLSNEDKGVCCGFLEALKKKYFEIVFELANKNPITKFILEKIQLMFEEIQESRERIAGIEKYISKEIMLDLRKFAELKKEINSQLKRIDDFVGRESLIHDFDSAKPLLIEGEVGIGKSYLLMRMASLYDGQYIPLKIVKDLKTFDMLVTDAKTNGRKLFIDDLDHASEEIKDYILENVWVAVMASRPPVQFEREIEKNRLSILEKGDIGRYFQMKSIEIENELLEKLEKDLSLPIKLRIFVDFLKSRNISSLDSHILGEILDDIGIEGLILPKDLEDWYDNFVWRDFDHYARRYPVGAKQVLFVLSLVNVLVDITFFSQVLEVNEEIASNIVESLKAFLNNFDGFFSLFHDSLSFFVRKKLGDPTRLHVKIGDAFSSLSYGLYFVPKWEALHHYRMAKEKERFEEEFDLAVMDLYRQYGFTNEVLENLTFAENCGLSVSKKGEFLTEHGVVLLFLGELESSLEKFEKALQIFEEEKNMPGIASAYGNMGSVFRNRGDLDKAEEYYRMSLEVEKRIGDELGMAKAHMNMGSIFVDRGDWDNAEEYFRRSLKIFEKNEDKLGMAGTYLNISGIFWKKGDWDKAEEYSKKGIVIEKEIGDKSVIAGTYMNMATISASRGDLDKAEEYYEMSLEIEEEIGHKRAMAQIYSNIGVLFEDRENWDKAEEYQEMSLKIFEEMGDKQGIARAYNNIGSIYRYRGNMDEAEKYYRMSLEIKKEIGDKEGIANAYSNIGWVYAGRGDLDKAEEYYKISLEIEEKLGDKLGMAKTYMNMGHLRKNQGNRQDALIFFEKARIIFMKLGAKNQIWAILRDEFKCYLEMNSLDDCIEKLSEMFENSYKKDLIEKTTEYLRDFVFLLFKDSRWEPLSRLEGVSPSIEKQDLQYFVEALSAYGKAKLKEVTLEDFRKKSSKIEDADLLEFLDRMVISDHTWNSHV